jgi:hypothetical protein
MHVPISCGNRATGFPAEFMKVILIKVCPELDFVHVVFHAAADLGT